MSRTKYGREGDVIYRFGNGASRDAWVTSDPQRRRAVPATEVPMRLKIGRDVPGLELRDGLDGRPNPVVIRRRGR